MWTPPDVGGALTAEQTYPAPMNVGPTRRPAGEQAATADGREQENDTSGPASARNMRHRTEPPWWVRDAVVPEIVGLIVGGLLMVGQGQIDESRAEREALRAEERRFDDIRLENVRFIREQAATPRRRTTDLEDLPPLPYVYMDLKGMNLSGLDLRRAELTGADLRGAILVGTSIGGSSLVDTDMRGAILQRTFFGRGVTLKGTDLRGTDLSGVYELHKANVWSVCYDAGTTWPAGYEPPESVCEESGEQSVVRIPLPSRG